MRDSRSIEPNRISESKLQTALLALTRHPDHSAFVSTQTRSQNTRIFDRSRNRSGVSLRSRCQLKEMGIIRMSTRERSYRDTDQLLAVSSLLRAAFPASAVPVSEGQTGMACAACHTVFPELLTSIKPLSVMLQISYKYTTKALPDGALSGALVKDGEIYFLQHAMGHGPKKTIFIGAGTARGRTNRV